MFYTQEPGNPCLPSATHRSKKGEANGRLLIRWHVDVRIFMAGRDGLGTRVLGLLPIETETFNGFANRFLWMKTRRSKYLPDDGDNVDVEPFRQRVRNAIAKAQAVGEMKRTEAAKTLWRSLYVDALNSEHPVLTRAAAITLRLSMLYALLDESAVIDDVHLRAAYAVWRYAQQSVVSIFGSDDADAFDGKVLAKVVERPGVSRKELYDAFGRNTPMKSIADALRRLETKRKVYAQRDETTGGRPAERWYPTTTTTNAFTPEYRNVESMVTPTSGVSGVTPTPDAMTFTFGDDAYAETGNAERYFRRNGDDFRRFGVKA